MTIVLRIATMLLPFRFGKTASVPVFVSFSARFGLCNRHDKAPMLHALQTNQAACELFDLSRSPVHDEDLQTRVVVEMRMTGRNYQFVIGMLKFRQLLCHSVGMVVVDEGDGANHRRIEICRLLGDQAIPNQITERFGPVGVAQSRNEIIEAFEKIGIECNSDSAENTHGYSPEENQFSIRN
jgi:hypothetical protein